MVFGCHGDESVHSMIQFYLFFVMLLLLVVVVVVVVLFVRFSFSRVLFGFRMGQWTDAGWCGSATQPRKRAIDKAVTSFKRPTYEARWIVMEWSKNI